MITPFTLSNPGMLALSHGSPSVMGGVITTVGDYKVHTFLSSEVLVVRGAVYVEVLVVAGGGGGGGYIGGGGGGGGYLWRAVVALSTNNYPVTVGDGGDGGTGRGPNTILTAHYAGSRSEFGGYGARGGVSAFYNLTALGGGGGAMHHDPSLGALGFLGTPGGSGGGSGGSSCYNNSLLHPPAICGGPGTTGQGEDGGFCASGTSPHAGAGGGGAGAVALQAGSGTPSAGGAGIANSISGAPHTYGQGGPGGQRAASGGVSGASVTGTPNTGMGGGGMNGDNDIAAAGTGGSGIVIIKWKFQ